MMIWTGRSTAVQSTGAATGLRTVAGLLSADFREFGDLLSVLADTERWLEDLRSFAPDLARSPVATSMLVLAEGLDSPSASWTSKSMLHKQLADAQAMLIELSPPRENKDRLDELTARRAKRLDRSATAAS